MNSPSFNVFNTRRVAIVGGGLVGALSALFFSQRGWQVDLFEQRSDLRRVPPSLSESRSINLALSVRGLSALEMVGLKEAVLALVIPMSGRMIHSGGSLTSQPYGVHGECINSVDRSKLNAILLDAAEESPLVRIHFNHKLVSCDLNQSNIIFEDRSAGRTVSVSADLILGADGTFSAIRSAVGKVSRLSVALEYIPHGYLELTIPPVNGNFAMDPHHLHIWPRQTFMMIALPNLDKSFTCTLFMPFENFDALTTERDAMEFFKQYFPDAIPLIGKDALLRDFFGNPRGSLASIKCSHFHYADKALFMGDAAHSMVPFYGQGMNAGFEDCRVFDALLTEFGVSSSGGAEGDDSLGRVLAEFSKRRVPDAHTICDLAQHNYVEMRSDVLSRTYLMRKKVESSLHRVAPSAVIPLYSMVSFSNIPYAQVMRRWKQQTAFIEWTFRFGLVAMVGIGVFAMKRFLK